MKIRISSKVVARVLLLSLCFCLNAQGAVEDCPPPLTCAPCGETIVNGPLPVPSTGACGVQPYQNYLATYENCNRIGLSGFYFGTGFGFGTIDYDLNIRDITFPKRFDNSYIIEYVTVGYSYSNSGFFIAGELGYYYDSVTRPVFFEDPSSIVFTTDPIVVVIPPAAPFTTTVRPCTVRLDINAQNHIAFDLLPGFALSPCFMFFGRVGVEYTSFSIDRRVCIPKVFSVVNGDGLILVDVNSRLFRDNNVFSDPFFNATGDAPDRDSSSTVDFRLGAGLAIAAGRHLSFTANYIHIFGSERTFTPNRDIINDQFPGVFVNSITGIRVPGVLTLNGDTLITPININPSRNEFLLGMIVVF